MRRLVIEFVSLDGVIQGLGSPVGDRTAIPAALAPPPHGLAARA